MIPISESWSCQQAHLYRILVISIEAMSRGFPVFAPAVGGILEVFDDGVKSRSIPLDDAQAAVRLILEWLDDEMVMRNDHAAARRRFLERFEADPVASELASFLDKAATV